MIAFNPNGTFYFGPDVDQTGVATLINRYGLKLVGDSVNQDFEGNATAYHFEKPVFEGTFHLGVPVRGKLISEDEVYEGEVNGALEKQGEGVLRASDGTVLKGYFYADGRFNGEISNPDGSRITGFFDENFDPIGEITKVDAEGNIYTGPLVDGGMHGFGRYELPGGVYGVYEGYFHNDTLRGYGKAVLGNGVYEGLWYDNRFFVNFNPPVPVEVNWEWTKSGSLHTNLYEGLYENKSGVGKIHYPNGSVYTGKVENGLANGKGILISLGGEIYEGAFMDGKFSGHGRLENGPIKYEGYFVEGRYSGEGKETSDGLVYEGHFHQGLRDGPGATTYANGLKVTAVYNNGILTGDAREFRIKNVTGFFIKPPSAVPINEHEHVIVYPTGDYLIAELSGDKILKGKLYYANGNTYEGQFNTEIDYTAHPVPQGQGIMVWPGKGVYTGRFKNGYPEVKLELLNPFDPNLKDYFDPKKMP